MSYSIADTSVYNKEYEQKWQEDFAKTLEPVSHKGLAQTWEKQFNAYQEEKYKDCVKYGLLGRLQSIGQCFVRATSDLIGACFTCGSGACCCTMSIPSCLCASACWIGCCGNEYAQQCCTLPAMQAVAGAVCCCAGGVICCDACLSCVETPLDCCCWEFASLCGQHVAHAKLAKCGKTVESFSKDMNDSINSFNNI